MDRRGPTVTPPGCHLWTEIGGGKEKTKVGGWGALRFVVTLPYTHWTILRVGRPKGFKRNDRNQREQGTNSEL